MSKVLAAIVCLRHDPPVSVYEREVWPLGQDPPALTAARQWLEDHADDDAEDDVPPQVAAPFLAETTDALGAAVAAHWVRDGKWIPVKSGGDLWDAVGTGAYASHQLRCAEAECNNTERIAGDDLLRLLRWVAARHIQGHGESYAPLGGLSRMISLIA